MINQNKNQKSTINLSVIFSFWNEEEVLSELIRHVRKVLIEELRKKTIGSYELIFVNDASTDRSLEILMNEVNKNKDIKIVNTSRNFGGPICILAGMQYASGNTVIYMDADLQDPPEFIPEMLRVYKEQDVDIVHTVRKSRDGESRLKLLITKLGYFILNKISSVDIQPEVGDFKVFSRRAVDHLIQLKENKPFIRGLVRWIGFKQTTIEYDREKRFAGETKFPILGKRVISNFFDSALISFSDVPLKLVSIMGFLVSFGTFLVLIYVMVQKFLGHNLPGWTAIMVAMLFLGSLELLALGILGLYINSIFIEAKRRPNFIIESVYGFDDKQNKEPKRKIKT
ncbi:MAG: glycosyltransferase [Patescibacteria group bacterium]|nr:glycosyltransferase [Patescibacteria group bacterium]